MPPPKASFKLLTANVKRLTAAFEPYTYYYNRILVLQRWDNPHETALMLTLYVLCCYYQVSVRPRRGPLASPWRMHGSNPLAPVRPQKLLPGFCGWVLALLVRGYLREVGYLKRPKTEESPDEDLSLRERAKRAFTVRSACRRAGVRWNPRVLERRAVRAASSFSACFSPPPPSSGAQVSRKVQNVLGGVADFLERIQNLLTWKVSLAAAASPPRPQPAVAAVSPSRPL